MTCIVGLVHGSKIYIGADHAGSDGHVIHSRKTPKVFKNGQFLIAYAGSFRMGDILQYHFTPPKFDSRKSTIDRFLRTEFIEAVKSSFREGGYGKIAKSDEKSLDASDKGGNFLVGFKGRLFEIEADFQVAETIDTYTAVGSGMEFALGSFFSTTDKDPKERVQLTLESAAKYCTTVAAPFTILSA